MFAVKGVVTCFGRALAWVRTKADSENSPCRFHAFHYEIDTVVWIRKEELLASGCGSNEVEDARRWEQATLQMSFELCHASMGDQVGQANFATKGTRSTQLTESNQTPENKRVGHHLPKSTRCKCL